MSTLRPFAVFDLDGTLIRWQLYHAIADELAREGHFGVVEYEKVRQARLSWKQRASSNSYADYEQTLIDLIDVAISGISVIALNRACQAVLTEYKDQVYTFTRDLISRLKSEGYLLFAISASQTEIVKLLAEYYQFDDYGGSVYETKNGYYTGSKVLMKRERKPAFLGTLVTKHQATWDGSIAVGDSESDIPMLASVQRPIAFNPTQKLFEHAKQNDWKIVIERKNVTYELSPGSAGYCLAE
ncbi:MAG: HAD family phosphatase [Candidatus Saccharibacteria bacterium]